MDPLCPLRHYTLVGVIRDRSGSILGEERLKRCLESLVTRLTGLVKDVIRDLVSWLAEACEGLRLILELHRKATASERTTGGGQYVLPKYTPRTHASHAHDVCMRLWATGNVWIPGRGWSHLRSALGSYAVSGCFSPGSLKDALVVLGDGFGDGGGYTQTASINGSEVIDPSAV